MVHRVPEEPPSILSPALAVFVTTVPEMGAVISWSLRRSWAFCNELPALLTLMRAFSMELSTLSPVMVQTRSPLLMVSPASQFNSETLPEVSAVMVLVALSSTAALP